MRRIIIPIVIVAGVFVWLVLRGGHEPDVGYTGTIEGRDVGLGSLFGGRVESVSVAEGDSVQPGDTILVFETRIINAQLREQQARVAQAQAALDRVRTGPRREEIERARIEWDRAERERKRREALLDQSLTSPEEYDAADAAAKAAFQSYEQLRRGSRSEDERQAVGVLEEAESGLAVLTRQREESVVRATSAGIVQTFDLRVGDLVAAGQPVVSVLPPGDLWVRVYVPENEIGAVHVDQTARLTVDTYPDRPFTARVIAVRDRAEYTPRNVQTAEQRRDRVFAVKLAVPASPELKPGMTATVLFQ